MTEDIDRLIIDANRAAAAIRRLQETRPTHAEVQEWAPRRLAPDLSRPRRRRHRKTPIEYRMSPAEFIISGTAASLLGGILAYTLAWVMFGVVR